MANVKISELTAIGSVDATDLFEVSEDIGSSTFASKKATALQLSTYIRSLAGTVRQVVQTSITSGSGTSTSSTYSDITSLSATITPASSSNKILVFLSMYGGAYNRAGSAAYAEFQVVRGTSTLVQWGSAYVRATGATEVENFPPIALIALDSPSTTSAITYKAQYHVSGTNSGETAAWEAAAANPAVLILCEVAG